MFYNIYMVWGIKVAQFIFILICFHINNSLYSYNEMQDTPDTLILTEQNNGDTVQVSLGTILILKLEAIPGTGYAWNVDMAKSNYLIKIEEPVFLPKEIDSTITPIGAPAYQVFRYRAQKEGTEILAMCYMRVWEKNKPPLKTFSITVSIQK
jgi:inhibitor of cysteine peptidase